jgi:phage terminase small subunit
MVSRKKNEPVVQQTSPVGESEQTAQVEKVECPPELGAVAREEWDRVAPHLVAAGRLKPLDRSSLAVYCAAYATWLEASQTAGIYRTPGIGGLLGSAPV